jgi:hypothetical protein
MATTTPLNGWPVPTSTDYVKDGATAIEALGDAIDTSVGSALLPWQTWAPTLAGGWANGNGTYVAKYVQIGKTVHVSVRFTIGTTTTKGTDLRMNLPVTAVNTIQSWVSANLRAGGQTFYGLVVFQTANQLQVFAANVAGTYLVGTQITATIPGLWATGESFGVDFTYQAA